MDTTVNLTAALEGALRRAALYELEGGADELRCIPMMPVSEPDKINGARRRIAHAGLLLDRLGYTATDQPLASVTAPVATLQHVASRALEDLGDQIREPGAYGHKHSPPGLRASADLWEDLERLMAAGTPTA